MGITETKEEITEAQRSVQEDRRFYIQAVIVRIMKSRQQISHTELIDEVIRQSKNRFEPSISLIKQCIEGLIEKHFIDRAAQKDQYVYIS